VFDETWKSLLWTFKGRGGQAFFAQGLIVCDEVVCDKVTANQPINQPTCTRRNSQIYRVNL